MRSVSHAPLVASLAVIVASLYGTAAIYREEAGLYDWHLKLVGTPFQAHWDVAGVQPSVAVGTQKNILASLDVKSGSIAWRQSLAPNEILHGVFQGHSDALVSISSASSFHVNAWDSRSGRVLFQTQTVHDDESAVDTKCTAASVIRRSHDLVALLPSCEIVAVSSTGKLMWSLQPDQHNMFTRIWLDGSSVKSIAWSSATETLSVRTINPADGSVVSRSKFENHIKIEDARDLFIAGNGDAAHAIWSHKEQAFALDISSKTVSEITLDSEAVIAVEQIFANGVREEFIAKTASGTAAAVHLSNGATKTVYNFGKSSAAASFFGSHSSAEDFAVGRIDLDSGKYTFTIWHPSKGVVSSKPSIDVKAHGIIKSGFMTVNSKKPTLIYRLLAVTADGSMHMIGNGRRLWTREESLSNTAQATFLDLPQSMYSEEFDELSEAPSTTAKASFVDRYVRRWSIHLAKIKSAISQIGADKTHEDTASNATLSHLGDTHGFKKLIIFASRSGKISALESVSGAPVWSRFVPNFAINSLHIIRQARVKFPPVIAVVGYSQQNTVIVRLNGITGELFESSNQPQIKASTTIQGRFKASTTDVVENDEHTHLLSLMDENAQIVIFPDSKAAHSAYEPTRKSAYLYQNVSDTGLRGYQIGQSISANGQTVYLTKRVWDLQFPPGEKIAGIAKREVDVDSVASIGRVLGDRTVLYKYLNPNILGIATTRRGKESAVTTFFYLVDTVSGSVIYRNAHHAAGPSVAIEPKIHILQCENWFVYVVWNHGADALDEEVWNSLLDIPGAANKNTQTKKKLRKSQQQAAASKGPSRPIIPDSKGVEVVVLEVYENAKPDVRIDSTVLSSFSSSRPGVQSQAYNFPLPVTAIGVTQTQASITTREVVLGLGSGMLYGLNKRLLDPRRPYGKPTAQDKEAGIYPYSPNLGLNSREIASYSLDVVGIEHVISASTHLESTSLVASYGLDVFFTRRTPSQAFDVLSPDFNYAALIATILALFVGIFVAKYFAERKRLGDIWA